MIDACVTPDKAQLLSTLIISVSTLCGVAIGSVGTWLIQHNLWDRQKQLELKHDVVLDAVRALADLDSTVSEHYGAFPILPANLILTKDAKNSLDNKRIEANKHLVEYSASYQRTHTIADVAIGGELSRNLSGYFHYVRPFMTKMQSGMNPLDRTAAQKELAIWHNRVILSARKTSGIKDAGDLPVLDYDNQSLTTDN
jgi:hypothetical protein